MAEDDEARRIRQGRIAALVVAGSGVLALIAPVFGLPVRWEILIYLVAGAGFLWALVIGLGIWLSGRGN